VVTFLYRCFGPANYGILTMAVSALVVLLIALAGVSPRPVIVARGINTTAGGLLALTAYAVWPTWQRRQLPEAMAALMDAYRQYYGVLMKVYLDHLEGAGDLDGLRLAARLARSNMEAAIERYRAEPGASPDELQRIMAMMASSHRFAHALMTIEAELAANPSRSLPAASRNFFDAVYRTLGMMVNRLRGSRPATDEFPDLRDAHTQLLESAGSEFVLLATETDRIANSLNTLREQITGWPLIRMK
jgi:uncharacterized membrane protein YccC